jgi:dienelactone hydrolase
VATRLLKLRKRLFVPFLAVLLVVMLCAGVGGAQQGEAGKIDRGARYLFYISGYIVTAENTRPTSPRFGVYEYKKIVETFEQRGFIVVSEARKQSQEIEPYARKVAAHVRQLLNAGVPPQNITVVGASQGAWMAMLVSTYVANRELNFVFVGACAADDGLLNVVDLHGNVLFISERTDKRGNCQRFRDDAKGLRDYQDLELNTGQKHGFLYRPLNEWVEPVVEWAHTNHSADKARR